MALILRSTNMTEAYLGNPNLYKANLKQEYTEEQIREIAKCMDDPIHFIKTYTRIVNIDEGLVPFNMYPFQEKWLIHYDKRLFVNYLGSQVSQLQLLHIYYISYIQ